ATGSAMGSAYPRRDGWTRVRYLREHLTALARAVAAGLPVTTYMHSSLYDNYEWGSFEPRFGLHAVARQQAPTPQAGLHERKRCRYGSRSHRVISLPLIAP